MGKDRQTIFLSDELDQSKEYVASIASLTAVEVNEGVFELSINLTISKVMR